MFQDVCSEGVREPMREWIWEWVRGSEEDDISDDEHEEKGLENRLGGSWVVGIDAARGLVGEEASEATVYREHLAAKRVGRKTDPVLHPLAELRM